MRANNSFKSSKRISHDIFLQISQGGLEDNNTWRPAPRGKRDKYIHKYKWKHEYKCAPRSKLYKYISVGIVIVFFKTLITSELIISKVLTRDSVTISVDAVVYYRQRFLIMRMFITIILIIIITIILIIIVTTIASRVSNSTMSKTSVENAHHSTSLLSQVYHQLYSPFSIIIVFIVIIIHHHHSCRRSSPPCLAQKTFMKS